VKQQIKDRLAGALECGVRRKIPIPHTKSFRFKSLSKKVQARILREISRDEILDMFNSRANVRVLVAYDYDDECPEDSAVTVEIGRRDWSFDPLTGELLGCGTFLA